MSKSDEPKILGKELSKLTKKDLKDIPLPSLIQALNDELVALSREEEKFIAWEEEDDDNDGSGGHLVRLDKELHMARLILLEKTKEQGEVKLDSKYLIAMVKLLSKSEKAMGWYGEKLKLWRKFLSLLVIRMKQEPIQVYDKKKPKQKRVVSDFKHYGDQG